MASERTIRLHRVLTAPADKVYRAFVEPDALARWLPPNGFTCSVDAFDAKVGGRFHMSFRNFTTGHSHSFGGRFLKMEPGKSLQYNNVFDDPNLPGEMLVTVDLRQVSCGTEMSICQAGIPEIIPLEACYLGWQESLRFLAKIVEPDIPQ